MEDVIDKPLTKVVHIITRLDMGGSAQNTLLTCLGLADRYDTMLIHGLSLESGMTPMEVETVEGRKKDARAKGIRTIALGSLVRRISPFDDLVSFCRIFRCLRREKPRIVHTHTSKAGILGRWAAWMAGIPIIVHTHHGHVYYGHFGPLLSAIFGFFEVITDRITDHHVALTEGEKNDHIRFNVSRPEKISRIHSGVDIEPFMHAAVHRDAVKAGLGIAPGNLVVGSVGWLLPIKGPMILLSAMADVFKTHENVTLVYVGKGALEPVLREEIDRIGVQDRVKMLGWRKDMSRVMQGMDIVVLPSLNEGMGRVLVEAMAAGKPVVASRTGGIPDLVEHGRNGWLVAPGETGPLASAIGNLIRDADTRRRMGAQGLKMAPAFSVEKMIEKIDALYRQLIRLKGKRSQGTPSAALPGT